MFAGKSSVLGVKLYVSHTASNVSESLSYSEYYKVYESKIHVIVKDSAANMTTGIFKQDADP